MGTPYSITFDSAVVRKDRIDELVTLLGGNPATDVVSNINQLINDKFDHVYSKAYINSNGDLDLTGIQLYGYGPYVIFDIFDSILSCCLPGSWFTEDDDSYPAITAVDEGGTITRVSGRTVYINHHLPVNFGNLLLDLANSDSEEDVLEAAHVLRKYLPRSGTVRPIPFLKN